jgi:hypothetical protein
LSIPGTALFPKAVERRIDRIEIPVQIFRLGINVEQSGHHLPDLGVTLQEGHGTDAIMRVVVARDLLSTSFEPSCCSTTSIAPGS